ncbi:MAG: SDR family NAD(P)-dependent oxidoreductase [Pirellulales bacterium]
MARRSLSQCRVIVTGASSGIGYQLALELAREGARLVVTARRSERLNTLADQIRGLGRPVAVVCGDIVDPAVRETLVAEACNTFGGFDLLINNAGVSAHGRFASASSDRLRRIMEVNFFAAAELIRVALPTLAKANRPMVVNVGSILGRRGLPRNSEYSASKFALAGLSEALRPELTRHGIDLLLVNPGTTDTDFFEHLIETEETPPWTTRPGVTPEKVARAIVHAVRRGKHEIVPSLPGRLLLWANRAAPRLVDLWMKKYG